MNPSESGEVDQGSRSSHSYPQHGRCQGKQHTNQKLEITQHPDDQDQDQNQDQMMGPRAREGMANPIRRRFRALSSFAKPLRNCTPRRYYFQGNRLATVHFCFCLPTRLTFLRTGGLRLDNNKSECLGLVSWGLPRTRQSSIIVCQTTA